MDVEICPQCLVPRQIVDGHRWLNNGVIVTTIDPSLRMVFTECENFDPIFQGIEKLIGVPIEHIIVDIERKGTRDYFSPIIPPEVKDMLKRNELSLDPIIAALVFTARINGLGKYELVEYRHQLDEQDHTTLRITNPHSIPIALGDMAGGCEAVTDREHAHVTSKEVSPGIYDMTASVSGALEELEGYLERKEYHLREGDIEWDRCPSCGGPKTLSGFRWDLDTGIIRDTFTGRRISIIHPSVIDPIFEVLEKELGEAIPEMAIEAQRRFAKTGLYSKEEISEVQGFRTQLALRGMGYLRELEMSPKGLRMRLDNACMHLMMVGLVQGLFEMSTGLESQVEWELTEDGDLELAVTPKT